MEKALNILACVGLAVMLVALGFVCGRKTAKPDRVVDSVTVTDTMWVEVHDTAFVETAVNFLRTDTVKLAYVPDSAISGTYQDANVHENGKTGTYKDLYGNESAVSRTRDTLFIHDSVYVEIPIETHTFIGDHYRITAHGYRVGLDDVWFDRQTLYVTKTETKYANKRWRFNVGAQIGYGWTTHGASPYAGIGVAFGYTF